MSSGKWRPSCRGLNELTWYRKQELQATMVVLIFHLHIFAMGLYRSLKCPLKTMTRLSRVVNDMAAEDLATQGTMPSAAMVLSCVPRNIPVSESEELVCVSGEFNNMLRLPQLMETWQSIGLDDELALNGKAIILINDRQLTDTFVVTQD